MTKADSQPILSTHISARTTKRSLGVRILFRKAGRQTSVALYKEGVDIPSDYSAAICQSGFWRRMALSDWTRDKRGWFQVDLNRLR